MPITRSVLLLLVPLLLIELGLLIWALVDLSRPERRVKGNSKLVWALVIIFVGTLGPLVYLLAGREEA